MSYLERNVDSSKPLDPPGKECFGYGSESQHGPAPPFKRQRNQEDHQIDSGQSQQNPLINEGIVKMFYKTRLCKKSNCSNGEICNYAHGPEELHDPPPNWKELVRANGKRALANDRRTQRRIPDCRHFTSKTGCRLGESCHFLHQSPNNTGRMLEQRNDAGHSGLMIPGSQRMNMQLPLNSGGPIEDASPAKVTETEFLNWRPPRKIAGIYGDWPEGYSLRDNN